MKNIFTAMLLVTCFFFLGCGSKESKSPEQKKPTVSKEFDYKGMAEAFCNCMRPTFELQQKLAKLAEAGKEEEIASYQDQIIQVQEEGRNCVYDVEDKYGEVEESEHEEKTRAALDKACPKIMEMMELAEEAQEE